MSGDAVRPLLVRMDDLADAMERAREFEAASTVREAIAALATPQAAPADARTCERCNGSCAPNACDYDTPEKQAAPVVQEPVAVPRERVEAAIEAVYAMIDPLRPPPAGSYWRGQHEGIAAAAKTFRREVGHPPVTTEGGGE